MVEYKKGRRKHIGSNQNKCKCSLIPALEAEIKRLRSEIKKFKKGPRFTHAKYCTLIHWPCTCGGGVNANRD